MAAITTSAFAEYAAISAFSRGSGRVQRQLRWIQRQAVRLTALLGLQTKLNIHSTALPILACNHVSYIDIVALASLLPVRLIATSGVRSWPWLGWLARCAGTIFIERQRDRSLLASNRYLLAIAQQAGSIVMFTKGTRSDGQTVLPYRSSMLAVAVAENRPVRPVWIGYGLPDGRVTREICWWGDMALLSHLRQLLGIKTIQATIRYGRPVRHWDRKALAIELYEAVFDLAEHRQPYKKQFVTA